MSYVVAAVIAAALIGLLWLYPRIFRKNGPANAHIVIHTDSGSRVCVAVHITEEALTQMMRYCGRTTGRLEEANKLMDEFCNLWQEGKIIE